MAMNIPESYDRFALVSSLYGPGTITCWYLTALSTLLSWTLHPRKSDSIDVDLVAVLTLPAVAVAHVISQIRGIQDRNEQMNTDVDGRESQVIAAIEAPLNVCESFMTMSTILFLVAAWMICARRAILVALFGLLCLAAESWIHSSSFGILIPRYEAETFKSGLPVFSRPFLADFTGLVVIAIVTLFICALISAAIAAFVLLPRHRPASSLRDIERVDQAGRDRRLRRPPPAIAEDGHSPHQGRPMSEADGGMYSHEFTESQTGRASRLITLVTTVFIPFTFMTSLFPILFHSVEYSDTTTKSMNTWSTINNFASRFVSDFFPRTGYVILDLDQAVPTAAGITVLIFGLYSVAKTHLRVWDDNRDTSGDRRGIELSRAENHITFQEHSVGSMVEQEGPMALPN